MLVNCPKCDRNYNPDDPEAVETHKHELKPDPAPEEEPEEEPEEQGPEVA